VKARRNGGPDGEVDPALLAAWCCPGCGGELAARHEGAVCAACGRSFPRTNGIHQLFWPHDQASGDVTEIVKAFYEEHPFPNYDDHESLRSLVSKSRSGLYAKLLGEQLPDNADVLEVGCGTGQLSNFLGITCRSVTGTDLCLNSLGLAEAFRSSHGLSRVRFLQMNLFRPALTECCITPAIPTAGFARSRVSSGPAA
jgi:SAM-dependent methyltransferase